jgi:hypothetical protein
MYELQHFTICDGWVNTITDDTENPVLFDSREEAQAELDYMLHDTAQDMSEPYLADEWRVVKVNATETVGA